MATTIQHIELPKKPRARDTSSSKQEISQELVTEGDFGNGGAAWTTTGTIVSADDGGAFISVGDSDGGFGACAQAQTLIAGRTYELNLDVTAVTGTPTIYNYCDSLQKDLGTVSVKGFTDTFVSDGTGGIDIRAVCSNGQAVTIDNISLKEVESFPNNNHGKIYSGRGLEFDGVSDYLSVADDVSIRPTDNITVACWVYRNVSGNWGTIWGKSNGHSSGVWVAVDSSGELRCQLDDVVAHASFAAGDNEMLDDVWYRIVMTYDSLSGGVLYINGQSVGTTSETGAITQPSSTAYQIGTNDSGYIWDGMMSDFQLWNSTWTQTDVTYDYLNPESLALNASGSALTESNLKLWYPMQDGHRGQQSYILDGANTGLGDEKVDLTTGSSNQSSYWSSATTSGVSYADSGEVSYYTQPFTGVSGVSYRAQATVSNYSGSGSLGWSSSGGISDQARLSANGDISEIFVSDGVAPKLFGRAGNSATFSNVSIKPINDKHHATTVFLGDELITDTNDRTFAGASHWLGANVNGSNTNNDFVTYNENYTGTGYSGGALQLVSDDDASNVQFAILDGAEGNGWETNMVEGRTYRLSFQAAIFRTSGTLSVGFADASHALSSDIRAFTATVDDDAVYTLDFVYNATNHAELIVHTAVSSQWIAFLDDISIKEVGVASGWTDADQQLHIPQPALQSYNELAWFDGAADYVDINPSTAIWNGSDGEWNSVSCWVNETGLNSGIFYWSATFNPGLYVKINGNNHLIGYNTGNGEQFGVTIASTSIVNKWNHWVMNFKRNSNSDDTVISGSDVELFLNGVKQTLSYISGDDSNSCDTSTTQNIDLMSHGTAYFTTGVMTEVSIWKDQLTDAEVLELYNDGKALDALNHSNANLSAYWRNNGLSAWSNLVNPGTNDGTPTSVTETILIPQGVDGSRDAQGFIMNKARNTSSLNFPTRSGDYAEVGDNPTIDFGTGDFSFECWAQYGFINNSAIGGAASGINVVFSNGKAASANTEGFNLLTTSSKFEARIGDGTKEDTLPIQNRDDDGDAIAYVVGGWYHIAVTRTGTTLRSYVDGSPSDYMTNMESDISVSTSTPFRISDDTFGRRDYKWPVDSVKLYGKELSDTEVQRNYKATKGSHRN